MVPTRSYSLNITGKLCLDKRVGQWCQLPYPDHPLGCPNYGKRNACPPYAPSVHDFFDLTKRHWFLITEFPFSLYIEEMRSKHPSWSEKRLRCLLYWQGHIRKVQHQRIDAFRGQFQDTLFSLLPEAMSINIFKTLRYSGVDIEVKPQRKVLKVALIGYRNPNFLPKLESCLI